MSGQTLQNNDTFNLVGVTFEQDLRWDKHKSSIAWNTALMSGVQPRLPLWIFLTLSSEELFGSLMILLWRTDSRHSPIEELSAICPSFIDNFAVYVLTSLTVIYISCDSAQSTNAGRTQLASFCSEPKNIKNVLLRSNVCSESLTVVEQSFLTCLSFVPKSPEL